MSDEVSPPPLRLKPRVRPSEAAAGGAVAPAAAPKLRVKPRLAVEASTEDAGAQNSEIVDASPESADPGAVPTGGLERSKFKFRAAADSEAESQAAAVTETAVVEAPASEEITEAVEAELPAASADLAEISSEGAHEESPAASEAVAAAPSDDPPVFPVMAPDLPVAIDGGELIGGLEPVSAKPFRAMQVRPEERRSFKIGVIATLVAIALILSGGTFYILRHFFGSPTPPPVAKVKVIKPTTPATRGANGSAVTVVPATPVATTTASSIGKAKDGSATRKAGEQARVDGLANGQEAPKSMEMVAASSVGVRRPLVESSVPAAAPTTLAPGVTMQTGATVSGGADASADFRNFVAAARITGEFQGTPSRAFINGRLMRAGELVDPTMGIIFERVDGAKKEIVFRDGSGAVVTRKY